MLKYIYMYVYERFMKEFGIKHTQYAILILEHFKENSFINYKGSITKNLQMFPFSWRSQLLILWDVQKLCGLHSSVHI